MKWMWPLVVLFVSITSLAQDWKWTGFEVVGNHKVTKSEILSHIPVKIGDIYEEDPVLWKKWCVDLKDHFKFYFTDCSSVRYINFQAFFVVEVIELGQEYRNQYRLEPTRDLQLASPEILKLYDQLYSRMMMLFNQGINIIESYDKGYLDYSDQEMHKVAEQLAKTVPRYRLNLLDVLENDKSVNQREKAANLLNWSVNELANSVMYANRLLDDPSDLVRNNISRFTLHFIDKVNNQKNREEMIDRLLLQLNRPSHADRNKAIYNLLFIAQIHPTDREYIKLKGEYLIKYIANTSLLDNVRDPAIQLLKLVNASIK